MQTENLITGNPVYMIDTNTIDPSENIKLLRAKHDCGCEKSLSAYI